MTEQNQPQKRKATVITADQFTQLLNHVLFENNLFVQTKQIEEAPSEEAPSKQEITVVLGSQVNTRSTLMNVLNTYSDQVNVLANKELGVVAKCDLLVGPKSTLDIPAQDGVQSEAGMENEPTPSEDQPSPKKGK